MRTATNVLDTLRCEKSLLMNSQFTMKDSPELSWAHLDGVHCRLRCYRYTRICGEGAVRERYPKRPRGTCPKRPVSQPSVPQAVTLITTKVYGLNHYPFLLIRLAVPCPLGKWVQFPSWKFEPTNVSATQRRNFSMLAAA